MIKIIIPLVVSLIALLFILWLLFGKNQKSWDEMNASEKKRKKLLLFSGIAVFIAGIATAFLSGRKKRQ